jgi:hypothetical protein
MTVVIDCISRSDGCDFGESGMAEVPKIEAVKTRFRRFCAALAATMGLAWTTGLLAQDASTSETPDKHAGQSNEELAKQSENPVADLISVPFQHNFNFGVGPYGKLQYDMNFEPVVPFHITNDWNLITRTIVPVLSQPQLTPFDSREFGIGDVNPTFFLSPSHSGDLIWGVGPTFTLPTATGNNLGSHKWSAGPAFVVLTIQGPWVVGVLGNNQWSFASVGNGKSVNALLVEPFVNYNFPGGDGWYVFSDPIITANWNSSGEKWQVPIGGGVGRLFKVGKLPIKVSIGVFDNVIRPKYGARWQTSFEVTFIF